VTLTRPAKPSQKKSKKPAVPGIPVTARLVASRIVSEHGDVWAQWLLLTNVDDVEASTIALWYYWRWQIECFFKLIKSAVAATEIAFGKRRLIWSTAFINRRFSVGKPLSAKSNNLSWPGEDSG
jgi:hypothetical protein